MTYYITVVGEVSEVIYEKNKLEDSEPNFVLQHCYFLVF